ncbi:HupE/UreJ family protein [Lichenicola cladoniae]|uniref:HupE/UreJ family protein n=1 Tax=Lichenicola cladoniae TaxID=1484109 RepID=A0A6M8HL88_9PROT|nr:HupE/UreJ family protein [Lichenicola cladoniae]NPD69291.1 HupE/UreJ family protein [Acetobacteraceae bacterium]QKE89106.1 HupE/UreJ family protein [Lichenicola cladoniae]
MMRRILLALVAIVGSIAQAGAHSASSSYLRINVHDQAMDVQWSIALRDLDYAIGLDANGNGAITWGELRQKRDAVIAYSMPRLTLTADRTTCTTGPITLLADQLGGGGYAVLRFVADCRHRPSSVEVRYGLMFDLDPMHRGLLNVVVSGIPHAAALSPDHPEARFDILPGYGQTVRTFFVMGIHHLLTGIDHMLFVTMLLVPAMFRRRENSHGIQASLLPVSSFRGMFLESVKVLSAFTLAHGTTLTLSVLHIVSVPERFSEAGIALTILITASDNIFHVIPGRRWPLAFLFGLVHGLGFATALGPLALPPVALGFALVSFNLGLEAAQVTIAAVVLPIGFALRNTMIYPRRIMPGLSGAVALVAMAWFTDRAFDLGLMPF